MPKVPYPYEVTSKSQNRTILGQEGQAKVYTLAGFASGALCLAAMANLKLDAIHKTKSCFLH